MRSWDARARNTHVEATWDRPRPAQVSVGEAHRSPRIRERVVAAVEAQDGAETLRYADAVERLAASRLELGKLAEAEPLLRTVMRVRQRKLQAGHPLVTGAVVAYADCLRDQAKYVHAEPVYEMRLRLAERTEGLKGPGAAAAAHDLAECLRLAEKRTAALPLHRRALKLREEALGEDHEDVAESLGHLGDLLRSFGVTDRPKLEEAEALYRRALRIREERFGTSHRVVAVTLHCYARVLVARGRVAEAEPRQPGRNEGPST